MLPLLTQNIHLFLKYIFHAYLTYSNRYAFTVMLAVAIAASWLEGLLDYFWSQPAVARKATTASNGSRIKTRGLGGRTKEMQKKLTAKSTVSISFARSVPP